MPKLGDKSAQSRIAADGSVKWGTAMQGREAVVFRGDRAGVSLWLHRDAPFGDVIEELRRKLSSATGFFTGATVRIETGQRTPDEVETRLLHELIRAHGMTLAGDEDAVPSEAYIAPSPSEPSPNGTNVTETVGDKQGREGNGQSTAPVGRLQHDDNGQSCLLVERTLRSGQRVQFDGSVVVLGDVNPGADIIATGNVIVMGSLRGMVHAGARGDTDSRVVALRLHPTQLRIAHYISRPPDDDLPQPGGPEMALIKDEHIQIEQFEP